MRITSISQQECGELLTRVSLGRLACALDNQPYIVPVTFFYETDHIYIFSTLGKKIEWMRQNPKVCLQVDEMGNTSNWTSVIAEGTFVELTEPRYTEQREYARQKLAESAQWWQAPLAERREQIGDVAIKPVFFRVDIVSMSGLRAIPEA
jgi:nitroimidazol reductase NimA-like FMN-containing flavoprotein (pyridoxamine 5'-phosphate oxidase superfamily)